MSNTPHRYPLRSRGYAPDLALEALSLEEIEAPSIDANTNDSESADDSSDGFTDIENLLESDSDEEQPIAMAIETFQIDPYDEYINPGTSEGAKRFTKTPQARTTLLTLTQEKAKEILSQPSRIMRGNSVGAKWFTRSKWSPMQITL